MSGPTPGTWVIEGTFVNARLPDGSLHPRNSEPDPDVPGERIYNSVARFYGPDAKANAALCAAAKDLRAALCEYVERHEAACNPGGLPEYEQACKALKAAEAK